MTTETFLRNIRFPDTPHPELREAPAGRVDRAVHVDAAAGVLDDDCLQALAASVFRRVTHAKIERETGEEHAPQPALAQITSEPGRGRAVVLIERRIGIDRATKALADHEGGVGNLQILAELRPGRALHAMIGPQTCGP